MTTLIVNYQADIDKTKFTTENEDILTNYKLLYVNDRNVQGVRVDVLPEGF